MAENKNKKANGETPSGDNKKKTNAETPSPAIPKGRWADRFTKLISLCSEIKNDPDGAMDFGTTLDENSRLKEALKKRDESHQASLKLRGDEVNRLKAEIELLKKRSNDYLEDFGQKYCEYDIKLKDVESTKKTLVTTKENLDAADKKIKKLQDEKRQVDKKVRDMETSLKGAKHQLSESQAECSNLQIRLKSAQEKMEFYGEDILTLLEVEEVANELEKFSEKSHQMVMQCFEPSTVPPKNVLAVVEHLDRSPGRRLSIPLTEYTTESARLMRCAAAELVIANAMVEHIFTDLYIPGDVERQRAICTTLELLVLKEPRREALVRCQLLQEYPANEEVLSKVYDAAFNDICHVLDPLLPAGKDRETFHARLGALLEEAVELWSPLQKCKSRVSAHLGVGPKMLNREEDAYPDYDGRTSQGAITMSGRGYAGSQPVLLLFPLFYMGGQVVCPATALWSDQGVFIQANNEASEDGMGVTGAMGTVDSSRPSAARRRMSIGGRMPVSPTTSLPSTGALTGSSDVSSSHLVSSRRSENGVNATARAK